MAYTKPDEDLLFLIKHLNKALEQDFDRRLMEFGLTNQQARLLFFVAKKTREGEVVHQNSIEKRYELSKSTVSGLVDRLVKKNLIKRINEKQFVNLVPTEEGMSIVKYFVENRNKVIAKLTNGLSQDEIDSMLQNIKLLTKNLKEEISNDKHV